MPRIFISYRRADSRDQTERIHDRLVKAFGPKNVFLDVDEGYIPSGSDFATVLRDAVRKCDVLLVIIGPDWLNIRDPKNPNLRRLDNPEDFVRIEVETGLQNASTLVIPVLVKDAVPLYAEELPDSLRDLTKIQVETIRRNPDFHKDVSGLIKLIRNRFPRRGGLYLGISIAIFTLIIVAILVFTNGRGGTLLPTQTPEPATAAVLLLTERLDKTLTAIAPTMTDTPDLTQTIDALVTQYFITETAHAAETVAGYTDTPMLTVTPSITSSPTENRSARETMNAATLVAVQQAVNTQMALDAENTRIAQQATAAQATLNAQATANVPTNTAQPTRTPTLFPTSTPSQTPSPTLTPTLIPTIDLVGTANLNATQTQGAANNATQAVIAAQIVVNTQVAQAQATKDAYTNTPSASLTPTPMPTPEPSGIVKLGQSINLRSGSSINDDLVTRVPSGAILNILGANEDNTWLLVKFDTMHGWVRADLLTRMPIAQNSDWKPVISTFNSVSMVLIPAGCFVMGKDDGKDYPSGSSPSYQICFPRPYWIDRTEVTAGMYYSCVDDGICNGQWRTLQPNRNTQAINAVSWYDAKAFCEWRDARLPTEAEWEYAARGPDDLLYSWGNDIRPITNAVPDVADVMSNPVDLSWVGTYDLMGNLDEWTYSLYRVYPYDTTDDRDSEEGVWLSRVVRGKSAYERRGYKPDSGNAHWGFRCVRDY